tara:strand:+ start:840 stop:1241 length:402 start_codon:yes stop_codon:yes gene_type:complete
MKPNVFTRTPLLVVVVLLFNLLALVKGGHYLTRAVFEITLPSGGPWAFHFQDGILALGLFILFVEVAKATQTDSSSIVDHALSLVLFIAVLIEFLTVKAVASSGFFLILMMCFFDVVAGFTVTITAARRDISH